MSSFTHFLGVVGSVIGLVLLAGEVPYQPLSRTVAVVIYMASMILLFACSTVYHFVQGPPERIAFWRRLDHSAIFVFVASSWTVISIDTLSSPSAYAFPALIWSIAVIGIVQKFRSVSQSRLERVLTYNAMGWSGLVVLPQFVERLGSGGVFWLLAGGALFGVGAILYLLKWPNISKEFDYHAVWHVIVLFAIVAHYILVKRYIVPH